MNTEPELRLARALIRRLLVDPEGAREEARRFIGDVAHGISIPINEAPGYSTVGSAYIDIFEALEQRVLFLLDTYHLWSEDEPHAFAFPDGVTYFKDDR